MMPGLLKSLFGAGACFYPFERRILNEVKSRLGASKTSFRKGIRPASHLLTPACVSPIASPKSS